MEPKGKLVKSKNANNKTKHVNARTGKVNSTYNSGNY